MIELDFPWLQLAILTPLLGSLVATRIRNPESCQWFSIAVGCLTLVFGTCEWVNFSYRNQFELTDGVVVPGLDWLHQWFVVDQLSAPLVPLTSFLFITTMLGTLRTKVQRFSFPATLFLQSTVTATYSSRNPWLIIALLALAVIPVLLELRRRNQSSRVFLISQGAMVGLLAVGQTVMVLAGDEAWLLGGGLLTAATLLRCGVFPLHIWVTDLFDRATFGTALLYATPMTGAYAVMRLVFPVAPVWALQGIAVLSLFSAVYAAGLALIQNDSRRFFCFLLISNMSLVLVGLEMATPLGLTAALCIWLAIGVSMHGFGLALRCVESRTGRLSLAMFHGLHEHTPLLAGMFLVTGLASIGFPGTIGFIGTELLVEGAVAVYPLVGLAVVVAAAFNGISVVKAYFHVFTGTTHRTCYSMKVRPLERITIVVIVILNIGGGLLPQYGVNVCYHAASQLMEHRVAFRFDRSSRSRPDSGSVRNESGHQPINAKVR